ncbi:MAG: hypothetical protein WC599_14485 [Bacteroidales bacterium]
MAKQAEFRGDYKSERDNLNMNLPVILFEEDGSQIVYCPALDIAGYGNNLDEAKESFKISLGEFFKYTLNKNTFKSELSRMGWTLRKSKYKPMHPPEMSKLLNTNENFNRIFNNFPFQKIDQNISFPVNV